MQGRSVQSYPSSILQTHKHKRIAAKLSKEISLRNLNALSLANQYGSHANNYPKKRHTHSLDSNVRGSAMTGMRHYTGARNDSRSSDYNRHSMPYDFSAYKRDWMKTSPQRTQFEI
jgi:hypothetical protein